MIRTAVARAILKGLALVVLGPTLAACSLDPSQSTAAQQLAEGVYLLPGINALADRDNRGAVGNAGFIVGPKGVAVIETGTSRRAGEALLDAVAATTRKPVTEALLTQALPEYVLGAAAFEARGIPLLAQTETATLMQSRCDHCLRGLIELLGEEEMRGSTIVKTVTPIASSQIDARIGRTLRLIHPPWSATPGDLVVFDAQSGVLFAGALVESRRIPSLRDAELSGWIGTLEGLQILHLRTVVPGHGAVGGPELIEANLGYLRELKQTVRTLFASGASLGETLAAARMEAYSDWVGYGTQHPANVQRVYRALEDGELVAHPDDGGP